MKLRNQAHAFNAELRARRCTIASPSLDRCKMLYIYLSLSLSFSVSFSYKREALLLPFEPFQTLWAAARVALGVHELQLRRFRDWPQAPRVAPGQAAGDGVEAAPRDQEVDPRAQSNGLPQLSPCIYHIHTHTYIYIYIYYTQPKQVCIYIYISIYVPKKQTKTA